MASAAQFEPNRLKFGPFSTQNCVRPEETAEYTKLSKALWKDLNPIGPVEQMLAVEIVRAAWRLHRCAAAEVENGDNPATQASVERARASSHNSMRHLLNDLRQFQSDRWLRVEVLREGFDEAYIGIDPINQTNRTQSEPAPNPSRDRQVGQALSPGNQTEVGQASRPVMSEPIPRNAPCPCHSGLKYKRCCGAAAPPVLTPSRLGA